MDKEELLKCKKLLHMRIGELTRDIGQYQAEIKVIEEERSADWIDKVSDEAPLKIMESLGELQRREMNYIMEALQRIEEGSYGRCVNCGGKIPLRRLKALPYAIQCIECKESLEQTG